LDGDTLIEPEGHYIFDNNSVGNLHPLVGNKQLNLLQERSRKVTATKPSNLIIRASRRPVDALCPVSSD
jgi:hypothetical protein